MGHRHLFVLSLGLALLLLVATAHAGAITQQVHLH
jgi:hypothetical protein